MRFLHLRLLLVDRGIQSGSPSLVMSTFWNCFSSNSDCGMDSVVLSGFSVPRGTLGGLYHRSFANFRLVPVFFLLWVVGGFSWTVLL